MNAQIAKLEHELQTRGRTVRLGAIRRLLTFWSRRTSLTATEIADHVSIDIKHRRPISLTKYGYHL